MLPQQQVETTLSPASQAVGGGGVTPAPLDSGVPEELF